jgi:hypothetical protein
MLYIGFKSSQKQIENKVCVKSIALALALLSAFGTV